MPNFVIRPSEVAQDQGAVVIVPVGNAFPNTGNNTLSFEFFNTYNVGVTNLKGHAELSPKTPNSSITVGDVTLPESAKTGGPYFGYVAVETDNTAPAAYALDITIDYEFEKPPESTGIAPFVVK